MDFPSFYLAKVVVSGLKNPLTYRLSEEITDLSLIGAEAIVEVGKIKKRGWIVDLISPEKAKEEIINKKSQKEKKLTQTSIFKEENKDEFKKIISVREAIPSSLVEFYTWIAQYYGVALASVFETALPKRSKEKSVTVVSLKETNKTLLEEQIKKLNSKAKTQSEILKNLISKTKFSNNIQINASAFSNITESYLSSLKALQKKGLISLNKKIYLETQIADIPNPEFIKDISALSEDQANAVSILNHSISQNLFDPYLLFGITGSGKTEVYLQAIKHTLKEKKSVLVILPEIALTPQFIDYCKKRLDIDFAVLHSQMSTSQRWNSWKSLLNGNTKLALGARSAIFAPLQNLGLIVVDEEHDSSYKQSDNLRYNARDLAIKRAQQENCPIVLGSATPSFETLLNVKNSRYKLLELPTRVTNKQLPTIEITDLNKIKKSQFPSPNISPQLYEAIKKCLEENEQILILYNKRGFASYLQCSSCQNTLLCPYCTVTMTLHFGKNIVLCHYCGHRCVPPSFCQKCRNSKTTQIEFINDDKNKLREQTENFGILEPRGSGTEKVVEELANLFPKAIITRMDRDTVSKRGAYREILNDVRTGKSDILVGTQMIAKGHDLPGVTLVGIINADIGLHMPDFRATERTYQLITQVAGRAGRGDKTGHVIVQTREPNNPTIVATISNKFKAFARYEMEYREQLNYPPYSKLLRVLVSSQDLKTAQEGADAAKKFIDFLAESMGGKYNNDTIKVLGPAPCAIAKIRSRYRFHILIKSNSSKINSEFANTIGSWRKTIKGFKNLRIISDIDPLDMM